MSQAANSSSSTLATFYTTVRAHKIPHLSFPEILNLATTAAAAAPAHAKAHPYRAGWMVLSLGLAPILGLGWVTAALLRVIGFGPLGPLAGECCGLPQCCSDINETCPAGSLAAWYQATWLGAYIPAGSLFSMMQRWAMT